LNILSSICEQLSRRLDKTLQLSYNIPRPESGAQ
jgi:hypothetical protein